MGLLNRMFNRVKTILQGVILTKGKCINSNENVFNINFKLFILRCLVVIN